MWLAQPEQTRLGDSRFEHIPDLPVAGFPTGEAKVMIGELEGHRSPAVVDWGTVGLDVTLRRARIEIPAEPGFEYAVIPIDHTLKVDEAIVEPGWLALIPTGAEALPIEASSDEARFLVLGGEPLGEPIEMWWNFVARSKDEITEAWRSWQAHDLDRFGPVSSKLARIDAPVPPWLGAG
jgi:hypothetical protein